MTGVSFTRGGYHRIGRNVTSGLGGYTVHRAGHWIFDGTGLGYGDVLGAGATVVGYECDGCVFTYRDGLPYPTGEDGTPATFEILGTCPTQHFTRETAPRPPKPGEPSELEYIASRVFGTREPEAMERIRHGHAVLGAYTNDAGATVRHVGLDRLGPRPGRARPADRADHPQRARHAWASGATPRRGAGPAPTPRAGQASSLAFWAANSSSVSAPLSFRSASLSIWSATLLASRRLPHLGVEALLLCSGVVDRPLGHRVPADDQVDEDAEERHEDHEDGPRRLAPAAQVAAAEDVAEHPEQQHQPHDPEEEDQHAPEHAAERIVIGKGHGFHLSVEAGSIPAIV